MSREIDLRDHTVNKITPARRTELEALALQASDRLPGSHRVQVRQLDALTGNPSMVASEAAPAGKGNYVQRALEHVRQIKGALGLRATQAAEFSADPHVQETSSGAVAVHLQQQHHGLPIFQATESVRFAPDGALQETVGTSVSVDQDLPVTPTLSVQDAVLQAARQVAVPHSDEQGGRDQFGEPLMLPSVDLSGFVPRVVAAFTNKAEQPTVLEAGPFGDVLKARLIWFPLGDELRLGWEVMITMPKDTGQYRTIVDAHTGEILYCRQLMQFVAARGNVFRVDGRTQRQMTEFPRPLQDYGLPPPVPPLPGGFPDTWVNGDNTSGNGVNAHLGASGPVLRGTLREGVVVFDPADPTGDDQKVLNIFYYNCFMHDYFYQLGFREADGNFQQDNFGRGGSASDPVDARAHSGAVQGTANMATPFDGRSPIMNMGLVTSTNRHTAFDSSVVFHEFTHGVTNRLVGGRLNDTALEEPQSGGMGEGWSDYIACTINNSIVVGDWVVGNAAGIREFPYDSQFPDHFGMVGTGRYTEVHNLGEIWCAALIEINRNIGANLAVQLVVDALKLTPANPSFLNARDAILRALDDKRAAGQLTESEHAAARRGMWTGFAKFGMGYRASSNGPSLSGIVGNFELPPDLDQPKPEPGPNLHLEAMPNLTIPDNRPAGISSVLTVQAAGPITRLTVAVDIEHSYIGDLRVSLITPSGKTVVLHDRSGASSDNIVQSYMSENISALAALVGEEAQGDWTLRVADLAPRDIGRLRKWSLDLGLETASAQVARGEARPGLAIPDNNPAGIGSSLVIAPAGTARKIRVGIDITHTYIGDLRVELVAPTGQQAILHNQTGGSQDNLIRTFESASTPALQSLVGQSIQGNWVLRVSDLAGRDVGKLNNWNLQLTYSS